MKKLLLFVLTLACFASFAEESRLERRLRIINERFAEEQETVEYIEAKKELINSEDVRAISCYKFIPKKGFVIIPNFVITKNLYCYTPPKVYEFKQGGFSKHLWLPKK